MQTHSSLENRWYFQSLGLTLFWAAAVSLTQWGVLQYETLGYPVKDTLLRFVLNFSLCGVFVFSLRRYFLLATIIVSVLFQFACLYYTLHFKAPPVYTNFVLHVAEGMEVADAVWALFPWAWFVLYCFLGVVGCVLALRRDRQQILQTRWKHALICGLIFAAVMGVLNGSITRSLLRVSKWYASEEMVSKYGITPVILSDALRARYQKSSGLFAAALATEKERSYLLNAEKVLPEHPKNIVVIQMESLDYATLNFVKNGRAVTPFLNSLLKESLHYRIPASTGYGSATADFVLLNGIPPAQGVFNYQLAGFPYNTSLPAFLKTQGYQSFAVHGVRSEFYNRGNAYAGMKFDTLAFKTEILAELDNAQSSFRAKYDEEEIARYQEQNWLLDEVVFDYAKWILGENADKNNFMFLITVSSHTPFTAEVPETIVPQASKIQDRYFNTLHYADQELASFYESLPDETLVVVYSDHGVHLDTKDFRSDRMGKTQFVPLIVSVKGKNMATQQEVASDGTSTGLSLRDAHSYIRKMAGESLDGRSKDTEPNMLMATENGGVLR